MPLETKDIEPVITGISEIKAEQKTTAALATEAKATAESAKTTAEETKAAVETIKTSTEEVKTTLAETKTWQEKKDAADEKNQKALDSVLIRLKNGGIGNIENENKSFNQLLAETIERNADRIRGMKRLESLTFDMMPEVKANEKGERELKAVGDMSIPANFPSAPTLYQDIRNLILSPYNRVWLADVLPQSTSTGTQLVYPKENGGEGGVAVWEDSETDKPQVDFDLTAENAYFKWIAGYVIVEREMLDDIPFLTTYLQNKLLISLKTAENAFILDGTSGAKQVPGFQDVASPYNGNYTNPVDRLIDAGWGQVVEATEEYYQPTNIILRPRDAVKIGLNKASGSGEYDLPEGSVVFVNGRLQIGGLDVVTTTSVASDTFFAFDKNATLFVRRMQPELRLFEDATLAKRNKVMFRIEERVTLAVFNNAAIVKGVLELS